MRVRLKPGVIVLPPENETEGEALLTLDRAVQGHVFQLRGNGGEGCAFHDPGTREEVCREPVNIVFCGDDRWRPISNLALTPFVLQGRSCAASRVSGKG